MAKSSKWGNIVFYRTKEGALRWFDPGKAKTPEGKAKIKAIRSGGKITEMTQDRVAKARENLEAKRTKEKNDGFWKRQRARNKELAKAEDYIENNSVNEYQGSFIPGIAGVKEGASKEERKKFYKARNDYNRIRNEFNKDTGLSDKRDKLNIDRAKHKANIREDAKKFVKAEETNDWSDRFHDESDDYFSDVAKEAKKVKAKKLKETNKKNAKDALKPNRFEDTESKRKSLEQIKDWTKRTGSGKYALFQEDRMELGVTEMDRKRVDKALTALRNKRKKEKEKEFNRKFKEMNKDYKAGNSNAYRTKRNELDRLDDGKLLNKLSKEQRHEYYKAFDTYRGTQNRDILNEERARNKAKKRSAVNALKRK